MVGLLLAGGDEEGVQHLRIVGSPVTVHHKAKQAGKLMIEKVMRSEKRLELITVNILLSQIFVPIIVLKYVERFKLNSQYTPCLYYGSAI